MGRGLPCDCITKYGGWGVTQKQQYQRVWINNDNKLVKNEADNEFKECLAALTCAAFEDLTAALVLNTHTTHALCTAHTAQSAMPITLPETSQLDSPVNCSAFTAHETFSVPSEAQWSIMETKACDVSLLLFFCTQNQVEFSLHCTVLECLVL